MSYRAISIIIPQNPNFIDGTVANTAIPAQPENVADDHTYYGNGCPEAWNTGGSDKSCTNRITDTYDSETQKIGTYYTFQAATSGSGASVSADNAIAPDTFCPLGWQMPYNGTGGDYYDQSRSWKYLFEQYNYGDSGDGSKAARSYPLSYVFSGDIMFRYGTLFNQGSGGFIWSPTVYTSQGAYRLTFWGGNLQLYRLDSKLSGYAIRCVHHFIDGTVEGNPTDLRTYIDTGTLRDHSYYGNGCPNGWGGDGTGGSITPCNTRIVQTEDSESQENGTYYHFQAATSGSGGAISTDNANVPDSFCPLGWQLPYGGTGGDYYNKSRSWNYLINKYGISTDQQGVKKINSYPFAYIFPGDFFWGLGRLYSQSTSGYFWSSNTGTSASYSFNVNGTLINTAALQSKVFGATVRCGEHFCIVRMPLSILSS